MRKVRIPYFRIWYSTTYTILFGVLFVALSATPIDFIVQSIHSSKLVDVFITGGVYFLTALLTIFIWASRIYTNRTVLADIPKSYVPIEEGEIGSGVRRMIVKALERSAIIAWDTRPRDITDELQKGDGTGTRPFTVERNHLPFHRRGHIPGATVISISPESTPWGHIAHPGWASPSSEDLSDLQFWFVILELPNLIEAKAVSLAPADPAFETPAHMQDGMPLIPDARIVAILQRPATMGLRDYLGHLSSFGLINPPSLGEKFLIQYEYARFSTSPLTETEFRNLMSTFAELLSGMTELDTTILADVRDDDGSSSTSSMVPSHMVASSSPSALRYQTPRPDNMFEFSFTGSPISARTAPSRSLGASEGTRTIPRAPSASTLGSVVRKSTAESVSSADSSSSSSLRSARSVIRHDVSPEVEPQSPYEGDDIGG